LFPEEYTYSTSEVAVCLLNMRRTKLLAVAYWSQLFKA